MSKNIYERIWLFKGRNTNPAHKDAFNLLISDLRKKNPQWDTKSIDDHGSTTQQGLYLRRKILSEKFDSCDEHCFYITQPIYYLYLN